MKDKKRKTASAGKGNTAHKKATEQKPKKNHLTVAVLVALAVIISLTGFYPSVFNEFTNWDDPTYVYENEIIVDLSPAYLKKIFSEDVSANYHPLTMLSLALDYHSAKLDPKRYHIVNLLLHLLNVALVFFFVYHITKKRYVIAFLVAVLFGVHPMHVESVAWVSERKDVLYTFFFLASLIAYVRYARKGGLGFYLLASLLFVFSLLSKAVAVTLPLVFFLIDYYVKRSFDYRLILEKIPLLALSVIFGIIAVKAQSSAAIAEFETFSIWQRVMFASYGFLMYIYKMVVPTTLSTFYPYPNLNNLGNLPLLFYLSPFIVLAVAAGVFLLRKQFKVIVFGMLFYFITVALVLQFISVGRAIIADRYTYVPYIGLFFIIAWSFNHVWEDRGKKFGVLKYLFAAALVVVVYTLSVATRNRCRVWQNSATLWTDVINKFPQVEVAYKNRGNYYGQLQNNPDKAFEDYKILLAMKTKDHEVYNNLGNIYGLRKEFPKSIEAYTKAVEQNPKYFDAYLNRAMTYSMIKDYTRSLEDYAKALKIQPNSFTVIVNRAYTYLEMGLTDKSIQDYNFLIANRARIENLYFKRGIAFFNARDYSRALNDFLEEIKQNPNHKESYYDAAVACIHLSDFENAKRYALKARSLGYPLQDSFFDEIKKKEARGR